MAENPHQGKYHLLAILLIPGFLVSLFMASHWIVPLLIGMLGLAVVWFAFRKS